MSEGPLFKAIEKGDVEQVRSLLASGIKPDAERGEDNNTALMRAVWNGYNDIVIALVTAKANIEATDGLNITPLMISAVRGHTDVVTTLVESKANVNASNNWNTTALMIAARGGATDTAIALVKAKADVNAKNKDNVTPLMKAVQGCYQSHIIVIELVKAKADINAKNNGGLDAICLAENLNRREIISVLGQARDDFEGFFMAYGTEEEIAIYQNNACRREYGRAFALASRVTKSSKSENITTSNVQERLPPGYRDLIEFFSRHPGLVKWTGIPLLLYFNAGSQSASLSGSRDN